MMLAPSAAMFLNSSFGFPDLLAQNLPSGAPNYPLAAPMARARLKLTETLTLVGAVFNGDPAGPGDGDPQRRDGSGTLFRLEDPPLSFVELWFANGRQGSASALPGMFKLGMWHHAGDFQDARVDSLGLSLASPASNGVARQHRGNHAFYAIADQMVWSPPDAPERGLSLFALLMLAPDSRNQESVFIEAGLNWKGIFESRPADVLGIAFAHARTSDAFRRLGAETAGVAGTANNVRDHETVIEATYLFQITPWWTVQPDLQWVLNPGAALRDSLSAAPVRDSVSIGVRTRIDF